MSRLIKFRAWHKKEERFLFDGEFVIDAQGGLYYIGANREFKSISQDSYTDDVIVQQFTGLKDIKGREIYEGDIVKCRGLLTWETVMVKDIRKIPVQVSTWPTIYGPGNGECEVIGNIHENPNLLK